MTADRESVSRLLRTARGQIDGILRMVEEDRYCVDISNQIMAVASVLRKANGEVLRCHLDECVRNAMSSGSDEERTVKIDELISVMERNL